MSNSDRNSRLKDYIIGIGALEKGLWEEHYVHKMIKMRICCLQPISYFKINPIGS